MLKPPYIIYIALLDKFLQINTNFFTRNEKNDTGNGRLPGVMENDEPQMEC